MAFTSAYIQYYSNLSYASKLSTHYFLFLHFQVQDVMLISLRDIIEKSVQVGNVNVKYKLANGLWDKKIPLRVRLTFLLI